MPHMLNGAQLVLSHVLYMLVKGVVSKPSMLSKKQNSFESEGGFYTWLNFGLGLFDP